MRPYIVAHGRRLVDAQAVAHAVVAREVRRGLGRRDEVVGRRARSSVCGSDGLDDLGAEPSSALDRRARTRSRTSGSTPCAEVLVAARRCAGPSRRRRAAAIGSGSVDADVESRGSWPAITSSSERASRTVVRERADLVERRRERDQAVARHAAVGRLQADDAAERRRLADRAAGVGAERERRDAGRDRRRRAAATSRPGTRVGSHGLRVGAVARSSRWTSPSRTRPCSSCRARRAPAAFSALDDVGVDDRAGSPRGCASRRWSPRPAPPRSMAISIVARDTFESRSDIKLSAHL